MPKCYLFEASVLDVELLGVNKVKEFAIFFSEEAESQGLIQIHSRGIVGLIQIVGGKCQGELFY